MLTIGITLVGPVMIDLFSAGERADDVAPIDAAGKIGDSHVLS
jgi:hypothetical protein